MCHSSWNAADLVSALAGGSPGARSLNHGFIPERRAYRLLFADEGTLVERLDDVEKEFDHPIVKEIVAGHGGQVTIDSTEGEGTTFALYLPKQPKQPQHSSVTETAERHDL